MILKRTVRRVICNSRSFISSISVILHWIPILYKDRDWDWYFLLKIERTKIRQMEKYFRESGIAEQDKNNARWLYVCDKLLSIMMDEDTALKYEDTPRETKNILDFPHRNYLDRYINTKNANRFFDEVEIGWLNAFKEGNSHNTYLNNLRISKAKHLYYKIRENFTFNWWN